MNEGEKERKKERKETCPTAHRNWDICRIVLVWTLNGWTGLDWTGQTDLIKMGVVFTLPQSFISFSYIQKEQNKERIFSSSSFPLFFLYMDSFVFLRLVSFALLGV